MCRRPATAFAALTTSLLLLGGGFLQLRPAAAQDVPAVQPASADVTGLTREQLAGLYRALQGSQFQPRPCVPGEERFEDVPAGNIFCPWIEEMARRGITTGCTTTNFCPGDPVNRAQMAVFVVRATEACPTLDPTDEMVRVGGICVDKYEASLWDAPVGGKPISGPIPCDANGQDCTNIYARSVAGVEPRRDITWFQAQQALVNSGKRLPTNAEWQMAAAGTPDHPGPCNTNSGAAEPTGSRPGCVSHHGVFDMAGNLWEWVADWVPYGTACPGWGDFSDDLMCLSGASTTIEGPGALLRGGAHVSGTDGGPFAMGGSDRPIVAAPFFGFRGAR